MCVDHLQCFKETGLSRVQDSFVKCLFFFFKHVCPSVLVCALQG